MHRDEPEVPVVTVLMPVYNGERFLRDQVCSILVQRNVDVRLVILDDGSTDESFTLATELARDDDRITIVERRPNGGLIAAVDRLLGFVDSAYFAMSDQDDVWDPDKLSRSVDALNRSGTKLVYSDVRIIDEHGTVIEKSYWTSRAIEPVAGTSILPVVFRNPIIGHTIVASADVAAIARGFPRDLIYYEVWLVAAATRLGRIGYVGDQLGSYRAHSTNVVGPVDRRLHAKIRKVLTEPKRLRTRQQQRTAALAAISNDRAEFRGLAQTYRLGFAGRVANIPRFMRELKVGMPAVAAPVLLRETLMFVVIGPVESGHHAQ